MRKPASLPQDRVIRLTRVLNAPRDLVYAAWTEPKHMLQWFGPRDFTAHGITTDVRAGGAWRACVRSPEGRDYWMRGIYREVTPPRRLVFTHIWEAGHDSPEHETVITITLEDLAGKTKLIFHKALLESVDERRAQESGWSEALDRLAGHLRAS